LNYDRVLEDTFLIAADKSGKRRFRPPFWTVVRAVGGYLWDRLTRRFKNFGTASVSFGEPLELSSFVAAEDADLTKEVAIELMQRINAVVPTLGVPLVARHLLKHENTTVPALEAYLTAAVKFLSDRSIPHPADAPSEVVQDAFTQLLGRELITQSGDQISVIDTGRDILTYYANSVAHHFDDENQEDGENAE